MNAAILQAMKEKSVFTWVEEKKRRFVLSFNEYTALSYSPFESIFKSKLKGNDSGLISGFVFYTYISIENDISVLSQHGRIEVCPYESLPKLTQHEWQGTWFNIELNPKGVRDGLSEGKKITISSQIGQVPEDGGDFLRFVMMVKKIQSSGFSEEKKKNWLNVLYNTTGYDGVSFRRYIFMFGTSFDEAYRAIFKSDQI